MLSSPVIPQATLVQPWALRPDVGAARGQGGRPCLITPDWVTSVTVELTGETLPQIAQFQDERRIGWKKFDLPAAGDAATAGGSRDELVLRLHCEKKPPVLAKVVTRGAVARGGAIPGPMVGDDSPLSVPPSLVPADRWRQAADAADALYEQHIDLISSLYESADHDSDVFFDGISGGVAAWPLRRFVDAWRNAAERNEPRPAFIVELAQTLPPLLQEVCLSPRKQLTRQRTYQPAGRIQEVDATCLRWLARQPGHTMAQRAGARQQAMGVDRVEHADTLENRIVRELMRQLMSACDRYMVENGEGRDFGFRISDFGSAETRNQASDAKAQEIQAGDSSNPKSEIPNPKSSSDHRLALVSDFSRLLDRLWAQSPLKTLTPIAGVPQPNYVLQQDPRYRPLWRAYVMLLKQGLQRTAAWRWRHRAWAEAVSFAMLAALQRVSPRSPAAQSSVLLRGDQDAGRFLDPRTVIGRFDAYLGAGEADSPAPSRRAHFVEQHQFTEYRSAHLFPEQLAHLCPDAVLVSYDGDRPDKPARRILAVWTMFDFDLEDDQLAERCKQIDGAIRMIRTQSEIQGLLVQPKLPREDDAALVDEVSTQRCEGLRLALPLQSQGAALERFVRQTLELV